MTTDTPPPIRPLPTSTTGLISPVGGTLFSEIDQTGYLFAPETFTQTITFTHSLPSDPLPPPPAGMIGIPGVDGLYRSFEVTALGADGMPMQPTGPVTITVDYSELGRGAAISGTLGLWRLDGTTWTLLPGVEDAVAGRLTATTDHFSLFAVFGETHQLYIPLVRR